MLNHYITVPTGYPDVLLPLLPIVAYAVSAYDLVIKSVVVKVLAVVDILLLPSVNDTGLSLYSVYIVSALLRLSAIDVLSAVFISNSY